MQFDSSSDQIASLKRGSECLCFWPFLGHSDKKKPNILTTLCEILRIVEWGKTSSENYQASELTRRFSKQCHWKFYALRLLLSPVFCRGEFGSMFRSSSGEQNDNNVLDFSAVAFCLLGVFSAEEANLQWSFWHFVLNFFHNNKKEDQNHKLRDFFSVFFGQEFAPMPVNMSSFITISYNFFRSGCLLVQLGCLTSV